MDIVVSSARAYISAINKMLGFDDQSKQKINTDSSQLSVWEATQGLCGPRLWNLLHLFSSQVLDFVITTSLFLFLFFFYPSFLLFLVVNIFFFLCIWRWKIGLFCGIFVLRLFIVLFLKNTLFFFFFFVIMFGVWIVIVKMNLKIVNWIVRSEGKKNRSHLLIYRSFWFRDKNKDLWL